MDMGMLRKDYKKFLEIARKELDDNYYLESWKVASGYGLPFAKIRMNGTKYIERNSKDVNCHSGIFVDIFPFDNVPDNKVQRLIHEYRMKVYQYITLELCKYKMSFDFKGIKGLIYALFKKSVKGLSIIEIKDKYEMISKKYNNKQTKHVVAAGGSYGYKKETIKYTWLQQTDQLEFEGHIFKVPKGYKQYLTYFYGDFMTPPPLDKRYNRHNIIEVKFQEEYSKHL